MGRSEVLDAPYPVDPLNEVDVVGHPDRLAAVHLRAANAILGIPLDKIYQLDGLHVLRDLRKLIAQQREQRAVARLLAVIGDVVNYVNFLWINCRLAGAARRDTRKE